MRSRRASPMGDRVLPVGEPRSWAKGGLVLLILFYFAMLGVRPLANPDEGRYAEIPREMLASGDWVTPRLDGVKYFEKPPLVYWLTAGAMKVGGVNEYAARFWIAVFAAGGVVLTYFATRKLFGTREAFWSATVLATSLLYTALGGVLVLDLVVTVFIALALFAFLLAAREPAGRARRAWWWTFYAAMALGALTKGLMAIALPGAITFLWVLVFKQWRQLRPFHPWTGMALFLLIAVPWHVAVARANPDFLYFYFVHEHYLRFTTTVHDRTAPWWYFGPVLLAGLFPWITYLPQSVASAWRGESGVAKHSHEKNSVGFLLIWAAFIFLFFSKSQSKLAPYILPMFPPLAVLIGRYVARTIRDGAGSGAKTGAFLYGVLAVALGGVLPWIHVARDAQIRAAVQPFQWGLALVFLLSGGFAAWFAIKARWRAAFVATAWTIVGVGLLFPLAYARADRRSTKNLAVALRSHVATTDRIFCYLNYFQDLPVYLARTVDVVDYEGELAFGIHAEPERTSARFVSTAQFLQIWAGTERCFAVAHRADAAPLFARSDFPHVIVAEDREHVVFSNR